MVKSASRIKNKNNNKSAQNFFIKKMCINKEPTPSFCGCRIWWYESSSKIFRVIEGTVAAAEMQGPIFGCILSEAAR